MRRWILLLTCLVLGAAAWAQPDAARLPVLDPNATAFPDASLADRSSTLETPAGKRGFCTVRDGHFAFADGTRVRFYGVNIAKTSVFIDRARIDQVVDVLARAGINLVRLHHLDDREGILDPNPATFFRKERLDTVDYWIARLKDHGIYTCLDLNDYRTFRAAEGVVNGEQLGRGARPYSTFDERLVALQKEFARRFLVEHVNPYTKLAYAADPAVALLEIHDENGLFIRRGDWTDLVGPYDRLLQVEWIKWLRARYRTTAALRAAWTDVSGACALQAGESLEGATVRLPSMKLPKIQGLGASEPLAAVTRVNDGACFAYDMQVSFLAGMRDYLREIGVRVPITAVGAQDALPDSMATASATDYIGINYYWDHPAYDWGKEWTSMPYYDMENPLTDNQENIFPAAIALARMHNKPLVVREMGYCYPNPHRGLGMLESAAYAALQDIDAIILFTYDTSADASILGMFDSHLDPLRWGLTAQAAHLFREGLVKPARHTIGIGYSHVDAFTWAEYRTPLYQLACASRVTNYTDAERPHPFHLLINAGRSSAAQWRGGKLLLFANAKHTDMHFQGFTDGLDVAHGYRLTTGAGGEMLPIFDGFAYDAGATRMQRPWATFDADDLRAHGLSPVGASGKTALGFHDPTRRVVLYRNATPELVMRSALDALSVWHGAAVSHTDLDRQCWRSDTGELVRDVRAEQLVIDTPAFAAVAGKLGAVFPSVAGALRVSSATPSAVVTAESLDGAPLTAARRIVVKMVTRADNTGLRLSPTPDGPRAFHMDVEGTAPIVTGARSSATPTVVEIGGQPLLQIGMVNGVWEYVSEPDRAMLYLDADGVTITLPRTPKLIRCHTRDGVVERTPNTPTIALPAGTRLVEISWR